MHHSQKGHYGDDEGRDVYKNIRLGNACLDSGRLLQLPLPPPTSLVRRQSPVSVTVPASLNRHSFIENSSFKTLNIYRPSSTPYFSCWTRFHKMGASNIVVWDEASLKREFHFDVYPPLGKMLVGLAGLLSGYDGSFEFKSGEVYLDTVPFVAMRVMLATFGVGMVPLAWYIAVELGMSQWACHLTAMMVLLGAWLLHL